MTSEIIKRHQQNESDVYKGIRQKSTFFFGLALLFVVLLFFILPPHDFKDILTLIMFCIGITVCLFFGFHIRYDYQAPYTQNIEIKSSTAGIEIFKIVNNTVIKEKKLIPWSSIDAVGVHGDSIVFFIPKEKEKILMYDLEYVIDLNELLSMAPKIADENYLKMIVGESNA
jgi:hypothetical protein